MQSRCIARAMPWRRHLTGDGLLRTWTILTAQRIKQGSQTLATLANALPKVYTQWSLYPVRTAGLCLKCLASLHRLVVKTLAPHPPSASPVLSLWLDYRQHCLSLSAYCQDGLWMLLLTTLIFPQFITCVLTLSLDSSWLSIICLQFWSDSLLEVKTYVPSV